MEEKVRSSHPLQAIWIKNGDDNNLEVDFIFLPHFLIHICILSTSLGKINMRKPFSVRFLQFCAQQATIVSCNLQLLLAIHAHTRTHYNTTHTNIYTHWIKNGDHAKTLPSPPFPIHGPWTGVTARFRIESLEVRVWTILSDFLLALNCFEAKWQNQSYLHFE